MILRQIYKLSLQLKKAVTYLVTMKFLSYIITFTAVEQVIAGYMSDELPPENQSLS